MDRIVQKSVANKNLQGNWDKMDLFPNRHLPGEDWDGLSEGLPDTGAAKPKTKKKYDFSKIDMILSQENRFITYTELERFMSYELQIGDLVEATKEIVYADAGVMIAAGRKGKVIKVLQNSIIGVELEICILGI